MHTSLCSQQLGYMSSRSSNDTKQQGDDSDHQEDMNQPRNAVYENAEEPSDDKDDGNYIKDTSHNSGVFCCVYLSITCVYLIFTKVFVRKICATRLHYLFPRAS